MAEIITLATLEIDANQVIAEQAELNKTAKQLREELKKLRKENQEGTEEYVKLEAELKNVNAEQRANRAVIEEVVGVQEENVVSISNLRKQNKALRAEVDKVNLSTEAGRKRAKELNAQINSNNQIIRENSDAARQQAANIGNYKSAIEGATNAVGNFSSGNQELDEVLGQAKGAIQGVSNSLKALLLNPVIAFVTGLVAVLGLLVGAWAKTEEGGDAVTKLFNRFNAVIDETTSRIAEVAKRWRLLAQAISLVGTNISAAAVLFKQATESFDDYREGLEGAIAGADQLTEETIKLRKLQVEVTNEAANTRRQFQEQLLISRDVAKSEEERIIAVQKAGKIESDNLRNIVRLRQQQLQVAKVELETTPENLKNDQQRLKVAEANKALQDAIADSLGKQRDIRNRINDLNNKIVIRDQKRLKLIQDDLNATLAAIEEEVAAEEEKQKRLFDIEAEAFIEREKQKDEFRKISAQAELEAAQNNAFAVLSLQERLNKERFDRELELAKKIGADTLEITRRYNAAQLEIDRARFQEGASQADQFFANLATAFGEGTAVAKAAAAAQATVQALVAANGAFAALAPIPVVGPALGAAAAAAALAAGYANVRAIYATDSGLPGDNASGSAPAGQVASAPQIGTAGAQVGQGIATRDAQEGLQLDTPETQTAVVIDQVTAAQNNDMARNRAATV